MEEYTIVTENRDNGQNTRIGVYAKHILEMHKKKYGETAATTVLDRAIRIFSESQKQLADGDINNNVLLVGKVQSGKTSNLEMLSGLAFDNGYNLLIIYGGYDKTLLKQTTDRFRKTYGIEDIAEEGKPVLLSTSDPTELAALNDEIFRDLLEAGKPVIITSMKRPTALEKVNETIRKLDSNKVHAYIFDYEGDQASLNTAKNRAEDCSATYEKIVNMKQLLNNPLYFSVTATPHANIFLDEISELIPGSAKLIEPGVGYCGGECYHMGNSEHIFSIDPDDTVVMDEGRMPDSLKLAVMHFVLASVITRKRSIKDSTMIIHSYRNRDPHSLIYTMVDTLRQEWINRLEDAETSLLLLDEFKNVYELLFDEEIRNRYPFDSIISDIKNVIKKVYVILKNSDGAATQGFEAMKKHRIYVGGDIAFALPCVVEEEVNMSVGGVIEFLGEDIEERLYALLELGVRPNAIEVGIGLHDMQVGVHGARSIFIFVAQAHIGNRLPLPCECFGIPHMNGVKGILLYVLIEANGHIDSVGICGSARILREGINGKTNGVCLLLGV